MKNTMSSNIQKYNSIIVFVYFTCWFISKSKAIGMRNENIFISRIKLLIENIKNRKELHDWINHPVLNLKGGGKKRKKKNYTKPKKVKHIRKKRSLRFCHIIQSLKNRFQNFVKNHLNHLGVSWQIIKIELRVGKQELHLSGMQFKYKNYFL